ncbi:hypothetical protein [Calothrix sp. NIES-2098]
MTENKKDTSSQIATLRLRRYAIDDGEAKKCISGPTAEATQVAIATAASS